MSDTIKGLELSVASNPLDSVVRGVLADALEDAEDYKGAILQRQIAEKIAKSKFITNNLMWGSYTFYFSDEQWILTEEKGKKGRLKEKLTKHAGHQVYWTWNLCMFIDRVLDFTVMSGSRIVHVNLTDEDKRFIRMVDRPPLNKFLEELEWKLQPQKF